MTRRTAMGNAGPYIITRRHLIKGAGAVLAGLAFGAANPRAQGRAFAESTLQNATDDDILNFALRLEYLQANFYDQVVASGLLSGNTETLLTRIRNQENDHIARLTLVIQDLGATPQNPETYNFGDLPSEAQILQLTQALEEVGVGAYSGVARFISDKANILAGAASILQVECRHTALVRTLRGELPTTGAFGTVLQRAEVLNQIGRFIR